MKNLSKEKLVLIKKLIGLGSCVLCLIFLLIPFIKYTSTSTLASGGSITYDDGVSLYNFLFNKSYKVFDGNLGILRDAFSYSYVAGWIGFILSLCSLVLFVLGVFMKKGFLSKIGGYVLGTSIVVLATLIFDREASGNTVRYLNVVTWGYGLLVVTGGLGVLATVTLKD